MMWFLRHVLLLGFEDVFAQVEERGADRLKGFKAVAERVLLVRSHFRQRLPYFGRKRALRCSVGTPLSELSSLVLLSL